MGLFRQHLLLPGLRIRGVPGQHSIDGCPAKERLNLEVGKLTPNLAGLCKAPRRKEGACKANESACFLLLLLPLLCIIRLTYTYIYIYIYMFRSVMHSLNLDYQPDF